MAAFPLKRIFSSKNIYAPCVGNVLTVKFQEWRQSRACHDHVELGESRVVRSLLALLLEGIASDNMKKISV